MSLNLQNNFGVSLGENKIDIKKLYEKKFSLKLFKRTISKTGPRKLYYSNKSTTTLDLALNAYTDFIKKIKNLTLIKFIT